MDIFCIILLAIAVLLLVLAEYYMKQMAKEIDRLKQENDLLKLRLKLFKYSNLNEEIEK